MSSNHKVGDAVRLNSGGPVMRVVAADGDSVVCEWRGRDKMERTSFPAVCVTRCAVDRHAIN